MVKRSGAHTAKPNEPTKLGQFLMQRLRAYQDGKDLISRQTAFEAGKIAMVSVGGSAHGVARALPLRAPMAQVEVLAWAAAAVEAVVRRRVVSFR
jgi:dihydroxyacetone kinase